METVNRVINHKLNSYVRPLDNKYHKEVYYWIEFYD